MRRDYLFKVFLTLLAIMFVSVKAIAQQITVNGVVQDTQGEPIIGANILIKERLLVRLPIWTATSN